jgi:hypothetical protein
MALSGNFATVGTQTTAAVGATNKVTALCSSIMDALLKEIGKNDTLTPRQQNKMAAARAHVLANIAQIQTAVGL